MAELFGIVAGGIGATSLAIQIIEKTFLLNALLESIKNLPSEVHDMLLEMELLASTLRGMEELYRIGPQTSMATSATNVIELCKSIAADLTSMAKELEACSSGRIKTYSLKKIKAVLQKDKINRMTLRIQRALRLLMMCNQVYMHNSQSTTLKAILDNSTRLSSREIASVTQKPSNSLTLSALKSHSAQPPLTQLGRVSWTSINSYWVAIGYLTFFNGKSHLLQRLRHHTALTRRRDESDVWRLEFRPVSWFGHRVYIVSARISFGNWQYSMISYNLRDPDAAIFIACQNGDVETVRQLLNDGLASPFDLTPGGDTPLHIAAIVASSEICQLLIDYGADGNFMASPGHSTPLMSLAEQAYKHDNEINSRESGDGVEMRRRGLHGYGRDFVGPRATTRDILDTVRVLVENGQSDPMIGSNTRSWDVPSVLFGWCGPTEPFLWLLRQDHFDVDIEGQTEAGDSIFHSHADWFRSPCGPRVLLDALFEEKHYPALIRARDNFGETVLHKAVGTWCSRGFWTDKNEAREVAVLYTLVQRLLEIGSDVYAQNSGRHTPLDVISDRFFETSRMRHDGGLHIDKEMWRSLARSWLAALVNAGHNLREYAETEQSLRPGGILQGCFLSEEHALVHYTIRIIYFYGEDPNDVDIDFEVLEEEDEKSPDISHDESSQEAEEPLRIPGNWQ